MKYILHLVLSIFFASLNFDKFFHIFFHEAFRNLSRESKVVNTWRVQTR